MSLNKLTSTSTGLSSELNVGCLSLSCSTSVQLPVYTFATLPSGTDGQVCYCSNGAAGSPILCFYSAGGWKRSDTAAPATAS